MQASRSLVICGFGVMIYSTAIIAAHTNHRGSSARLSSDLPYRSTVKILPILPIDHPFRRLMDDWREL